MSRKRCKMEISFIIPVYNTPITILKRCIHSIKQITNLNYEIIVIDDGSKEDLSKEYEKKLSQDIKYYKISNNGVSNARNVGISKSKGKYIYFVDSDDTICSEAIENSPMTKGYDVIFFDMNIVTNKETCYKEEITNQSKDGKVSFLTIISEFIENEKFYSPCSKLYLKDFITKNNIFFDINMIHGEDAIFNLNILEKKPNCYYVKKASYNYYYSFSTMENRVKKYPQKMIDNLYVFTEKKLNIIRTYLKDDMKFIIKVKNKFMKELFTLSMYLCKYKEYSYLNEISQQEKSNKYNCYKLINRLKKNILVHKKWKILNILSLVKQLKDKRR